MIVLKLIPLLLFTIIVNGQNNNKLHTKALLIDSHNDLLSSVVMEQMFIEDDLLGKAHSDLARLKKGGVDIQVFSVFCDEKFGKDTAYKYANIQIDSLQAIVARNTSRMMMVHNPAELRRANKQQKLGCMIGVEGGHMIEDNLDNLEALYRRGARYLTLTWNNSTSWATSAADEARLNSNLPLKGLTDFGRQVIQRMNNLGMMVDVSHVGEQTFWDVMKTTSKPVIASHSSVYALCPVPRNLKDDQIKAIAKNGGVVQVNFYSGFIDSNYFNRKNAFMAAHKKEVDSLTAAKSAKWEIDRYLARRYPAEVQHLRPPLSLLMDHIEHIIQLVGIDYVGLGSDFDGIESAPRGMDDVTSFPLITKELVARGYSNADIKKVLGGNFLRVFKANQKGRY